MRYRSLTMLAVVTLPFILAQADSSAQRLIARGTDKPEEMLAVLNAGKPVPDNDITVLRFRFLLNDLSSISSEPTIKIADSLTKSREILRETYGKDVRLLELAEAAFRSRQAISKNNFASHMARVVMILGSE